jgi:hypothetical protein
MAYPRSRTRVSSDASRLQRYLHLDRVSHLELVLVSFAELSLFVESQSSLIWTFPEFPGSVRNLVLGAVAYIACWILEIRSFTPIIVVGTSVSNEDFVVIYATYHPSIVRFQVIPSSYDHFCFL